MEAHIAAAFVRSASGGEHHQTDIGLVAQLADDGAHGSQFGFALLDAARPLLVRGRPVGAVINDDQNIRVQVGVGCRHRRPGVNINVFRVPRRN